MRIVFLGTPDFALPCLQMLIDERLDEVVGVFTQPDKAVGRKQIMQAPPVKLLAQAHGIPVFQFASIRDGDGLEALSLLQPDLMITAAFGQILSQKNLDIPALGCINVHGSLLPRYRGAAPIQWAVIDGLKESGITTMYTSIGIDSGDILLQNRISIGEDETADELFIRMAKLGAETLRETLAALENGSLTRNPQDEAAATHCRMLTKEDGRVDWSQSAKAVHDRIRGLNSWPGAFTELGSEKLKVWRSSLLLPNLDANYTAEPGEILIADEKRGLIVMAKDAPVAIMEIQAPGSKRMDATAFLRGHALSVGEKFN